jgi:hypothetical protein
MWPFGKSGSPAPSLLTELGRFEFSGNAGGYWSSEVETTLGKLTLMVTGTCFDVDLVPKLGRILAEIAPYGASALKYVESVDAEMLNAQPESKLRAQLVSFDPALPSQFRLTFGYDEWPDYGVDVVFRDGVPIDCFCGD